MLLNEHRGETSQSSKCGQDHQQVDVDGTAESMATKPLSELGGTPTREKRQDTDSDHPTSRAGIFVEAKILASFR